MQFTCFFVESITWHDDDDAYTSMPPSGDTLYDPRGLLKPAFRAPRRALVTIIAGVQLLQGF
jgi:hypothetical protein